MFITYHSWWRRTHHVWVRMHPWRWHWSPVGIKWWWSTKSGTTRPSKVRRWWTSEWRSPWTITPSTESWWSVSWRRTSWRSEVVRCPASSISYTEKGEKEFHLLIENYISDKIIKGQKCIFFLFLSFFLRLLPVLQESHRTMQTYTTSHCVKP